ncbi:MAG: MarR family winged helix-turn-helix transcriptional regulator [Rhizobiaceae bacterium]
MCPSDLDLQAFLPFRLNRLAAEMSRRLLEIYGDQYGIDIPEWRIMATLGKSGTATAQEVVRSTRTHKSTISRAVSKLIAMGWLERVQADGDRRNLPLRLTETGARCYGEIVPKVLAAEREVLGDPQLNADQVLDSIAKLERALGID